MDDEDYETVKNKAQYRKQIKRSKSLAVVGDKRRFDKEKENNKVLIGNKFLEYFDAFQQREEFMTSGNEQVNGFDFTIESFNQISDKIVNENYNHNQLTQNTKKKKGINKVNNYSNLSNIFFNTQSLHEMSEKINKINQDNLFDLIVELLSNSFNMFIYGYGSKLKLIYQFVKYFQERINGFKKYGKYHILIFNCFNPEQNLKVIISEIQKYIINLFATKYEVPGLSESLKKNKTSEEHIQAIITLIQQLELKGFDDKFLLIFNNIDGPSFMNKMHQGYLSSIANISRVNMIATCDNTNMVYLWNQSIKDSYAFYFLKFHTFCAYDVEISDINSLNGEKSIRSGAGLEEIFASLPRLQKDIIKALAKLQLNEEWEKMTMKGAIEHFRNECGINCNDQNRLHELILEAKDHEIIIIKQMPKTNKEILKLNLDKEVIHKIINGEYFKEKNN